MTHHLHVNLPAANLSFFLDVTTLDEARQALTLLDSKIAGPHLVDQDDLDAAQSIEDLIVAASWDPDTLDITQLSRFNEDPDHQPLPSAVQAHIEPTTKNIRITNHHPLLPVVDNTFVNTFYALDDDGLSEVSNPDDFPFALATGAIYGAYHQALSPHLQIKRVLFSGSPQAPTGVHLYISPFTTMQQALAANGIR